MYSFKTVFLNFTTMYFVLIIVMVQFSCIYSKGTEFITYGTVLKLLNTDYKVRLHSHDVKYGTGSGQQSVTGTNLQDDVNSHWIIKGPSNKFTMRGQIVECGDMVRLEHLSTSKNLHSHHFSSPLSGNQEISAYGKEGDGDTGDHWVVVCDNKHWKRNSRVSLRHVDTDAYLSVSGEVYGRPIESQMEIVGTTRLSASYWQAAEGLFIHKSEFNPKEQVNHHSHEHTEL